MVIPEEAVQAVHAVILPYVDDEHFDLSAVARAALEAAAPHMLIHLHHHDIEKHAASFNEGYETAMAQELADDPTTAQDWLEEKMAEAKAEGWDASTKLHLHMFGRSLTDNPYRSKA